MRESYPIFPRPLSSSRQAPKRNGCSERVRRGQGSGRARHAQFVVLRASGPRFVALRDDGPLIPAPPQPPEKFAGNVGPHRDNGVVAGGVAGGNGRSARVDRTVRVRLLGQFAIASGDQVAGPWPRPTAKRLCELVLVSPGRRVSRDVACEELFPRLDPRTAARSLSKALSMAR